MKTNTRTFWAVLTIVLLALSAYPQTNAPTPPAAAVSAAPAATDTTQSVFTRGFNNFTGLFKQQVTKDLATEYFKANTLDVNLSATYTAAGGSGFDNLWTSDFKRGLWGLNVGSMFWISKYIGAGVDLGITDINNPASCLFDYGAVDVALRYPIGRFCPYIIGSAGRNFDANDYFFGVGPGVSFAITERAKLFADGRFMWKEGGCPECVGNYSDTYFLARMGITFSF